MYLYIDEKKIREEQLDDWKLKHANRAMKLLKQKKREKTNTAEQALKKLSDLKTSYTYEEMIKILGKKIAFTTFAMKIATALSRKRKISVTEIRVFDLTAREIGEGIERLMTESSSENYNTNLSVCPEHYALRPTENGMFEVIETPGNSPLPVQFYISFGDETGLVTPANKAYQYQSVGLAKLKNGVVIGGVRHQFRDIDGGCEARLAVEFPSIVPNSFIKAHQWHLATEFSAWLHYIAAVV